MPATANATASDLIVDTFKDLVNLAAKKEPLQEQAKLLVIINELFADDSCRCEETEAIYGEDSQEAQSCNKEVGKAHKWMEELYVRYLSFVKGS